MIRVDSLVKTYKISKKKQKELGDAFRGRDSINAVDGISFRCEPGRVFALLGPNGAGKTTALRTIATMLQPTSGTVTVAGHDTVGEAQDARAKIGFLTGNTGLYDRLTATEMVRYQADLFGMDGGQFDRERDRLFAALDMNEFAERRVAHLSTGMKQKVNIARTMIHDPPVLVFDEPTAGLDVMTSRAIVQLIRDSRDAGKTVLFSTHIMSEVKLLCDDIAIIHRGKLFFSGTVAEFEAQMQTGSYEDEFIRLVEGAE